MNDLINNVAQERALEIRKRLKRFKLVFVQCGSMFDMLREPLLSELGGTVLDAVEFAANSIIPDISVGPVILNGMERFARTGQANGVTLGSLRMNVNTLRDSDIEICMISRCPRIAYAPVIGSNLLDDASPHYLPLLKPRELGDENEQHDESALPDIALDGLADEAFLLRTALNELGMSALTELDFALYEARDDSRFVRSLDSAAADALRGAGLVHYENGELVLIAPIKIWRFRESVADVIADLVQPQADLANVSQGLWQIERTIRRALRSAAIEAHGAKWRKNLFNESIATAVLERARSDVNATASNISELRDPIEWLSLGELLEVVQSRKFDGLFWDSVAWRRFTQDVVPIRNRLSHMRLLKKGDQSTVHMWLNRIESARK